MIEKTEVNWRFHWVPHLVQQVQSRHVGLLSVQELAGDLKQLLFICLLETESTLLWVFTCVVILTPDL